MNFTLIIFFYFFITIGGPNGDEDPTTFAGISTTLVRTLTMVIETVAKNFIQYNNKCALKFTSLIACEFSAKIYFY